jgi:hypothetical protein
MQAVLGAEAEKHGLAAEEDDGELRVCVLEGEVNVAGGRRAVIRDLALHPNVAVLLLYQLTHLRNQLVDWPDAARSPRLVKPQAQLGLEAGLRRKSIV